MPGISVTPRSDAFDERRKRQEVWRSIRRIIDLRVASQTVCEDDNRQSPRLPLTMPVLVQGFNAETTTTPGFGISKNISDDGISVICPFEINTEDAFFAIWHERPFCFIGTVRQSLHAGAGFWEFGVEFREIALLSDWVGLRALAMSLNPDSNSPVSVETENGEAELN